MKNIVIAMVITALLIGGYFGYRYNSENKGQADTDMTTTPPTEEPASRASESSLPAENGMDVDEPGADNAVSPADAAPLPSLGESDAMVRETLAGLANTEGSQDEGKKSDRSLIEKVLNRKNLIRKLVTAVDLVGREKSPWKLFNFLRVDGHLVVEERGGKLFLSPKNYQRYDVFVETVADMNPVLLAESYRRLQPLLTEAFDELGNEDLDWPDRLTTVLDNLNELEVDRGDIELLGREGVYIFADSRLESLPPVHKLLIRMGPEHTRVLREKLDAIRQKMGPI